jgi:TolB-like protein/tRNA A-37 threonylcarbamoyl transferase component Bud32
MTDATTRLSAALADRYVIERELGAGGMATVYLAQDLKHTRRVAIKVLRPELAAALGHERFLREITTTANLRHPHILPLYDSGDAGGFLYYVMPYVEGESLRERLNREKQLPVNETLRIAREVGDAIGYAHDSGVVHRDIKPENILLESGHAVVADFGIARAVTSAGGEKLTQTGLAIGTPLYMSPEQAAGDPATDHRADLYAWGMVVWEALAGAHPFADATTPQALLAAHMTETPPDLAARRPDVPRALDTLVRETLEKDPARRPESAKALLATLDRLAATPSGERIVPPGGTQRRVRWIVAAAALLVMLAVAIVAVLDRSPGSGTAGLIRSIAVLPLDNYSGDASQDYFAEGVTDELTARLASLSQLRVTSRGSAMQFQGRNRPATPAIAKALDVDAVVEGSVTRSGDRVRITAQLIDARADRHLWAQSFERSSSDVLALQAELAGAIASEINVRLTPGEQRRLAEVSSVDPAAHDAYLKGRYFFNRPSDENLQKAITQFEEAIRLSPTFAPAYSGLSDAYLWAGYNEGFITASAAKPKARVAAERAVELDDNSAEAHASLATFKLFYEYDWEGGEREYRRAIDLNPNYAFAHDQFGMLLAFVGRFDESIAEGARAIALDPLSPQVLVDATMPFIFKKDFAAARELARRAGELDPTFFFPVMSEGWIDLNAGSYRDAIPALAKATTMDAPPFVTAYLAFARGAAGDRTGALAELDALRRLAGDAPVLPFNLALVYLGLGERGRAIDYLERALAADSQMLGWLGYDAIFDSLREEPRFVALLKRLRFFT